LFDFWVPFGGVVVKDFSFEIYPNVSAVKEVAGSIGAIPVANVNGKVTYNPNHPEFRAFEYLKSVTPAGIIPKVFYLLDSFYFFFVMLCRL
jgi:hypothetical protein